jgi:uncharacterized protein (TIGR01777 family)
MPLQPGSRIVLAGGSGFIGRHLTQALLAQGVEVTVLSRRAEKPRAGLTFVQWDGKSVGEWAGTLNGAAAIINLAGTSIATKWTLTAMKEIVDSRVLSSRAIGEALSTIPSPPPVWVNTSAIGFYGNRGEEILSETSAPGLETEFLVDCCQQWEAAARESCPASVQLKFLRVGIVFGRDGGSFPILKKLTSAFLGGVVGSGAQYQSWIHVEDLVRMYLWMAGESTPDLVNGTSPHPETQASVMSHLRAAMGRPWAPPAPSFAIQLASLFGAPDATLVLEGQRVLPQAALEAGFSFHFKTVDAAIQDLVAPSAATS